MNYFSHEARWLAIRKYARERGLKRPDVEDTIRKVRNVARALDWSEEETLAEVDRRVRSAIKYKKG